MPLDDALAHDESLGDAIGRLVSSFALLPELAGAMVQAGVLAGEDYRRETERLIREHTEGGAVILGRAGAVILRDEPDALHVRLDGPPERRVAQAMELEDLARGGRRAPAQERRPRPRGLRAPLLRLRRARPRALSPRDRLDRALAVSRSSVDVIVAAAGVNALKQRPDHAARERVEGEVEADERG